MKKAPQTVIQTSEFDRQAKRISLNEVEVAAMIDVIAHDPLAGDVMEGTGGVRKMRHPGHGQGKSGGYRTIHYFGGDDIPVFLLDVLDKREKGNLSKAERNQLASVVVRIADAYRKGIKL
ncbi:conserved hypothetical protein [Hyphomicrobiales bacterium]|nr:conserved hypothetical protein [Hyphomicrobiales bacterium]